MSRFSVWLLCCAVVLVMLGITGGAVNIRALLNVFTLLGAPLLLHWMFSSEKAIKDVEEQK